MTRPENLRSIPLNKIGATQVVLTMAKDAWDEISVAAYNHGTAIIELNEQGEPWRAYRRCDCCIRQCGEARN
jgi:hypothetical protein